MTACFNRDFAAQCDFRTAVSPLYSYGSEAAQRIGGSHGGGGQLYPGSLFCQVFPKLGENLVFQGGESVLGGEYLVFQFF